MPIYLSLAKDVIKVTADIAKTKTGLAYQIVGIDGKVVKSGVLLSNSTSIDVSGFAKGVYLIRTTTGNIKFIKE